MNANDRREVFETVLPAEALQPVIAATKPQERERKLNAQLLLRAMIIAAATGYGGRQADVMRQTVRATLARSVPVPAQRRQTGV